MVMCDHRRPAGAPKPSCGDHGAEELRAWLKQQLREEGNWGKARVVTASCLDTCPARGVTLTLQGRLGDGSVRIVDPEADRQALLEEIRACVSGEEEHP